MEIRIRVGACVAIALAALVAGCGSSAPTPTKDEFLSQADKICATGDQQIRDASQKLVENGRPSNDEINQFIVEEVIPNIENQADQIRELGAPEGDEDQVNAIVDAVDKAAAETKANPDGAGPGPFEEANKLAQDYGLKDCGSGSTG